MHLLIVNNKVDWLGKFTTAFAKTRTKDVMGKSNLLKLLYISYLASIQLSMGKKLRPLSTFNFLIPSSLDLCNSIHVSSSLS
jgi:hypothetical protein